MQDRRSIDRAWDGRPNPAVGVREPPDSADFERTLQFVRAVIRESERGARLKRQAGMAVATGAKVTTERYGAVDAVTLG